MTPPSFVRSGGRKSLCRTYSTAGGKHSPTAAVDIRQALKISAFVIIHELFPPVNKNLKGKRAGVESIIKCRRNRYGFSCIIFLSEGRRKEVKTLNGYSYLTLEQRREIERMYAEGERVVDIAARLKRSAAAIYEELKRGYTGEFDGYARPKYSADLAQATVQENFRRRGNRRGANC
jgi:hypothetical protein